MSEVVNERYRYTQNRELSWLRFNRRVLEEAADCFVPALERLKFVAIFSGNLDEFFMVRAGSLFDIAHVSPEEADNKTGMTAMEQLRKIYHVIPELIERKEKIYTAVMEELKKDGVEDVSMDCLSVQERKFIGKYYKTEMLPVLSPIIIGPHHPVPHFKGKCLYAAAFLDDKKGRASLGIVPLPESLPPVVFLEENGRYVRTEAILERYMPALFGTYTAKEVCVFCITRNADISFDEEKFEDSEEDFRRRLTKLLKKRNNLFIVRLELNKHISEPFRNRLAAITRVEPYQIFVDRCPLNMSYAFLLAAKLPGPLRTRLLYPAHYGRWPEDLNREESMIAQIRRNDRMLFYPYDSVEPFLRLLNEAAEAPDVLSIKITIYRLASSSKIAQTLCRAAENGKEVLVLMELRARFDEANNLAWSKMLEESGCQVVYGMEGFKCHSKICLLTTRSRGKTGYITQIGTGNYNEKTNAMYTDLCLMTADYEIGGDAAAFFRNMLVNNLEGDYRKLRVSPFGIKAELFKQIDAQIARGKEGYICIKANAITEREIIDKLCEASCAGVEVQLIIRGICCILPGIAGLTENIHITSIVGRYLEHARVYLFGRGEDADFFISSADLMTRNLNRRVEIAVPIRDAFLCEKLRWLLDSQLRDSAKASSLLESGAYLRKQDAASFDSQAYFMDVSPHVLTSKEERPRKRFAKAAWLLEKIKKPSRR